MMPKGSETERRDQFRPDQPRPDQSRPDLSRSDQPRPDQPRPDQPRLDQPRPDQPRPDQLRPDQKRPEQYRPDQARLNHQRPHQERPDQLRPDQPRSDNKNQNQGLPTMMMQNGQHIPKNQRRPDKMNLKPLLKQSKPEPSMNSQNPPKNQPKLVPHPVDQHRPISQSQVQNQDYRPPTMEQPRTDVKHQELHRENKQEEYPIMDDQESQKDFEKPISGYDDLNQMSQDSMPQRPVLKRSNQLDQNRGSQVLVQHPTKQPVLKSDPNAHQRGPQTPPPRRDEKVGNRPVLKEPLLVDPLEQDHKQPESGQKQNLPAPEFDDEQDFPVGERRQSEGRKTGLMQMFNALRSNNRDPHSRPSHGKPPQRKQAKNDRPSGPKLQPKQGPKKRPPPPKQLRPPKIRNGPKRPKNSHRAPKPSSSYGAPKAPLITNSYGAPTAPVISDSYGAPKAPVVDDSYGSPKAPVADSYGSPQKAPETYGAPPQAPAAYSAPQQAPETYGAPQQAPETYGAPTQAPSSYSPPQQAPETYGAPQQAPSSYGAPQQAPESYGSPPQAPSSSYQTQNLTPQDVPFESSQKDPTPPSALKPSSYDNSGGRGSGFLPTATRNNFDESITDIVKPEPEKFSFFEDSIIPPRSDQNRPREGAAPPRAPGSKNNR